MSEAYENSLLKNDRDFYRQMARVGIPVMVQQLILVAVGICDTIMVGKLSEEALASVGAANQIFFVYIDCVFGFLSGVAVFSVQYWGIRDLKALRRLLGIAYSMCIAVGVPLTIISYAFAPQLIALFSDDPTVVAMGTDYLRIVVFTYLFTALTFVISYNSRAVAMLKWPTIANAVAVGLNIFLNWVLIFGHLGLPALGVRGAALATVLAQAVSAAVIILLARRSGHRYLLAVRRHFGWGRDFVRVYLKKCFPIIMNEVLIGVGNMVINIVLGRQPEEAIAALAVFRTLEGLVIGFFAGFSNASSVLVGTQVGAGRLDVAYQRAWRLVYLCQAFIGCIGLLLIALHTPILRMMGMQGESFRIAFGLVCIYAAAALIRMGNWTQNDTFRAAGDATFGTVAEIVFMWLMVLPCVWLTGMVWKLPTLAVFACCYIDEPIRYVMMQVHLFRGKWIKPVTPEGREALAAWKPGER